MSNEDFINDKQLQVLLKTFSGEVMFEKGVSIKVKSIMYEFIKNLMLESKLFCNRNKRKKIRKADIDAALTKIIDRSFLGRF